MPDDNKAPFPTWLRELIYIGGIIVALTTFQLAGRSDQRSTREEVQRMAADIKAIREQLPNVGEMNQKMERLIDRIQRLESYNEKTEARWDNVNTRLSRKGM